MPRRLVEGGGSVYIPIEDSPEDEVNSGLDSVFSYVDQVAGSLHPSANGLLVIDPADGRERILRFSRDANSNVEHVLLTTPHGSRHAEYYLATREPNIMHDDNEGNESTTQVEALSRLLQRLQTLFPTPPGQSPE